VFDLLCCFWDCFAFLHESTLGCQVFKPFGPGFQTRNGKNHTVNFTSVLTSARLTRLSSTPKAIASTGEFGAHAWRAHFFTPEPTSKIHNVKSRLTWLANA
jgi:hypothetical protein